MTRIVERLDDYRPLLEALRPGSGSTMDLSRYRGTELVTCGDSDSTCTRAVIATAPLDVDLLLELVDERGLVVRAAVALLPGLSALPRAAGAARVIHELKTWPAYFERLADGTKTFEIRRNDRGFQAGDTLRLREYDPTGDHDTCPEEWCATRRYSGRVLVRRVGFIAAGTVFGLDLEGYVVLSLLPVP